MPILPDSYSRFIGASHIHSLHRFVLPFTPQFWERGGDLYTLFPLKSKGMWSNFHYFFVCSCSWTHSLAKQNLTSEWITITCNTDLKVTEQTVCWSGRTRAVKPPILLTFLVVLVSLVQVYTGNRTKMTLIKMLKTCCSAMLLPGLPQSDQDQIPVFSLSPGIIFVIFQEVKTGMWSMNFVSKFAL